MRQVITIGPDGSMSGLQRKPGQGIDLRQFGHADIKRASLVEWDADQQAWYINVLEGKKPGVVRYGDYIAATIQMNPYPAVSDFAPSVRLHQGLESPMLFDDYDDAVKVEIAYLDALRLKGEF